MQERAAALLGKRLKPRSRRFRPFTRCACASCAAKSGRWAIRPASPSTIGATRKAWPAAALREIKVAEGLLRPGDLLYFISRWKTASRPPGAGGCRWPRPTRSIWPRRPTAAIRRH